MSSSGSANRESNQALLFRLSTALKKVDRLKSAQANVLNRMELARKITPGRVGENVFSPLDIKAKATRGSRGPAVRLRSPLQARDLNAPPPVVPPPPAPIVSSSPVDKPKAEEAVAEEAEEYHPLSSLRKRRYRKSVSLPSALTLSIPDSPVRPGLTFKRALKTPVKRKGTDFISPGKEFEVAEERDRRRDEEAKRDEQEEETLQSLTSLFVTPSPPPVKEDVGIVLRSIAKEGEAAAAGGGEAVVIRNLQRALKREAKSKSAAIKAVEKMHEKITEMHGHVEVAFKMKKVAENKLADVVADHQAKELESLRKVKDLQQTIQAMEKGHQIQKAQSDKKVLKLKKKLVESQRDISSLETHLHKYERQINSLQAQIELLRRSMLKSTNLHRYAALSPAKMRVLERISASACGTPSDASSNLGTCGIASAISLPSVDYTPSILDALNIEMF
ncbi:hypothetical protein HOP50_16g78690 [Chloropicon primus]|nr:hypothetical protein HOP50_16g78690 [Chloropicon primus]